MRATRIWVSAVVSIGILASVLTAASCSGDTTTTSAAPSTGLSSSSTDGQSTVTSGPIPTTTSTVLDAAALYTRECSGCHKQLRQAPGGVNQIRGVITMGKGGMPPFSGTLTVEQIAAIAEYVANGGR